MVGFVGVQQASKVRKADVQHTLLAEKATAVFEVSPVAHPACAVVLAGATLSIHPAGGDSPD